MINVIKDGDVYNIYSKYDPNVISIIKNVPGRKWIPAKKLWTIPNNMLGWLVKEFQNTPYENQVVIQTDENININSSIDSTKDIPNIDISGVPFYVKEGAKPFNHQLDFMRYAINRRNQGHVSGFIVADDQGLAKTCEVMNYALYCRNRYNYQHCLVIVCINNSKYNWVEDILSHTRGKERPYILGSRLKRDNETIVCKGGKEKLEDLKTGKMYGDKSGEDLPYFLIVNIEALRSKSGRQYYLSEEIINWVNSGKLQMIAIDEVHKNTSPSSIQGKQLIDIKKKTGSRVEWLPMTGTPITKRPTDVYLPLKLIDGHSFTNYYKWCQQFCIYGGYGDHEIIGYKNIPHLKDMLQGNMLRRLKSDVLDLPPKIQYTRYVDNTPYQEALYKKLEDDMKSARNSILSSNNPMAAFLRLRQVNGSPELVDPNLKVDKNYLKYNAKLVDLLSLLEEIHERGEKAVVLSNWVEPLRTLYKFVSQKYNTCCFTGTMKEEVRQKHKKVFQENPAYTVILGTIAALGTTHTLTAATNLIFYDEPWNPNDRVQGEDRIYRIGTTSSVNIYAILSRNTVDDRVHNILYTKEQISNYIVDNRPLDMRSNPDLFDMLLGDSYKQPKLS